MGNIVNIGATANDNTGDPLRTAFAKINTKFQEIYSVTDAGAVGDGVTDDTVAVTSALAAAGKYLYVPAGTYLTTLAASAITKTLCGPGTLILTGGQKLPDLFTYTSTNPGAWSTPGNPALAFSQTGAKSPLRYQGYVTGAATAGQPTSGYSYAWDLSQLQQNLYVASGWNDSTSDTTGRTMVCQQYNYLIHAGQGDVCNFMANGYASNSTPARSSHWLADPAITALAGGASATSNSVNLVGCELGTDDGGHETTMSGYTSHITRTVQPSPNTKQYVCVNFGATSNGSKAVDAFYYGAGKAKIGIDFTASDMSTGSGGLQAALATKADQFWYLNASNSSTASTPEGTSVASSTYFGYQSASSAIVGVNGSAVFRLNSYGFVLTSATPLYTQGGRVKGTRVVTAAGAVTITAADEVVVVNKTSGAATTVNLNSSPTTGQSLIVKDGKGDAATNNITLVPASGTIDGAANKVINSAYGSIRIVYNGTQWNVI